jgi:hypothetical protein
MTPDTLESANERINALLNKIAERKRPCEKCGVQLWFVRHIDSGKLAPYTYQGINHFANCAYAAEFRKPVSGRKQ